MVVVNGLSVSPGQGLAAPSWTWSASSPSSCSSWRTSCALWPSRPACFAALRVGAGGRTRSLVVRCKAPSLSSDEFEKEVVQSEVPVLVDFWAEWCGPCKLVAPIMDSLAKEYQGKLKVYKIETDSNPSLVEKYKVYGLPTLILFKDGEEVPGGRREGAINKKKLKLLLDELLGTVSTV